MKGRESTLSTFEMPSLQFNLQIKERRLTFSQFQTPYCNPRFNAPLIVSRPAMPATDTSHQMPMHMSIFQDPSLGLNLESDVSGNGPGRVLNERRSIRDYHYFLLQHLQ